MLIRGGEVALPFSERFERVDIRIHNGKIAEIGADLQDDDYVDAGGLCIVPGGIDPHVHFDDPGYTAREDFEHGTMAAASGGITTIIDMPDTSVPPVTNLANLKIKISAISRKAYVDYGLYGGVSGQSFKEGVGKSVHELAQDVLGFKTYFTSGMETFGRLTLDQFREALEAASEVRRPVLLHAEDFEIVRVHTEAAKKKGSEPVHYYESRPEEAEITAVLDAVTMAKHLNADLHIVHLGSAGAGRLLEGTSVTAETGPHYLEFDLDDFKRMGAHLKITPPLKNARNKPVLWDLLSKGVISFVASDHAPCSKAEKNTGSIWTDYAGIPGTGTLLPYVYSEGFRKGRLTLRRFVESISTAAAKRYGIDDRKGSIEIGKDADLVLIDPKSSWEVCGEKFYSKGKVTPFEGRLFQGRIQKTILRGMVVYDCDRGMTGGPGQGVWIRRIKK